MFKYFKIIIALVVLFQLIASIAIHPKPAEAAWWLAGLDTGFCKMYGAAEKFVTDKLKEWFQQEADKKKEEIFDETFGISLDVPIVSKQLPAIKKEIKEKSDEQQQLDKQQTCEKTVQDFVLAELKNRILDRLVDQTVKWIQGDGTPQFITNPQGFFEEAGQAAVGDVAQEIGLGDLCIGGGALQARLQLNLMKVGPLAPRVSCTLDQIVGNIQNFRDNFLTGGWFGYQELLSPRNNSYGITLMAMDEANRKEEDALRSREIEALSGQGFLSGKACYEWTFYGPNKFTGVYDPAIHGPTKSGQTKLPTALNDEPAWSEPEMPGKWKCTKEVTVTPGRLLGDAITDAANADYNKVINADTISDYLAAITDAIFYRISKENVSGLKGLFSGGDSPARGGGSGKYGSSEDSGNLKDAGDKYFNFMDRLNKDAVKGKNTTIESLNQKLASAEKNLNDARPLFVNAQAANETIITTIDVDDPRANDPDAHYQPENPNAQLMDCLYKDGGRGNATTSAAMDVALADYDEAVNTWQQKFIDKIAEVDDKKTNTSNGLPYYVGQVAAVAAAPNAMPSQQLINDVQDFTDATDQLYLLEAKSWENGRVTTLADTQATLALCVSPTWPTP